MKKEKDGTAICGEIDEELAGILTAISIVSKRLAKKILTLPKRENEIEKGGKENGQNE